MKLEKNISLGKFIEDKLQREELMKLSKEELIERYIYRMEYTFWWSFFLGLAFGIFCGWLIFINIAF